MSRARPPWLLARPFAHRGLHDLARGRPENSLAAVAAAIDAGYGIEVDLRLAADGVAVVHDEELTRLTGAPGAVARLTLVELARRRLLGTAAGIPGLAELLALVAGRTPLLLELKAGRPGLARAVAPILRSYGGPLAILSFDPGTVAWFARHAPTLPRGQLIDRSTWRPWRRRRAEPHFLACDVRCLGLRSARRARSRGLPMLTWTVRTEADRQRAEARADNMIFEGFLP